MGHTETCRGGELLCVRIHVCGSVVFTTKTAHKCTKTPSPLYRLPGQQERNRARSMLRIKETRRRKKRREGKKGQTRHKRQTNRPRLIQIQLLEGGSYRETPAVRSLCLCVCTTRYTNRYCTSYSYIQTHTHSDKTGPNEYCMTDSSQVYLHLVDMSQSNKKTGLTGSVMFPFKCTGVIL